MDDARATRPPPPPATIAPRIVLPVRGMTCASCVAHVEQALVAAPGVARASVNLATESAAVEGRAGAQLDATALRAAVSGAGYEVATRRLDLAVQGMTCASCVARVEHALGALPGVLSASVNLASERATIESIAGTLTTADALRAVKAAGYDATADAGQAADGGPAQDEARAAGALAAQMRRALLALALAAPLAAPMILAPAGIAFALPVWLQALLATIVQFWSGRGFYAAAARGLRARTGNMDLLVALGTLAAWGLSMSLWWTGAGVGTDGAMGAPVHGPAGGVAGGAAAGPAMGAAGGAAGAGGGAMDGAMGGAMGTLPPLYFESAAVVIALVLTGRWLEARARRRTSAAIRLLAALRPARARVRRDGVEREVPLAEVRLGEQVIARPGERIAVDGLVRNGNGSVDESMLTGESVPADKQVGDVVRAGTLLAALGTPAADDGTGALQIEVTGTGGDTLLARIIRLVEDAQAAKPPIQRLVDRVAAVFVPAVLVIAVATLAGWLLAGAPPATAIVHAVTVLVIACPCALGLATPCAIICGTGAAARHGILIRDAAALETARRVDSVVFDKTGTLTAGHPRLAAVACVASLEPAQALAWAVAVNAASTHPLALALRDAAAAPPAPDGSAPHATRAAGPPVIEARVVAGKGVRGRFAAGAVHATGAVGAPGAADVTDAADATGSADATGAAGAAGAAVAADAAGTGDDLFFGAPRWLAELQNGWTAQAAPTALREAADRAQREGQTVSWLFRRPAVPPVPAAIASAAASPPRAAPARASLAAGLEPLAVFAFADTLKAGARAAIDDLTARHLAVLLLSGDNPGAVAALAGELGITQFEAQVSPRDKAARVNARKVGGHVVAMVGDGINDAPALAAADVGIAMGGAEALAGAAGTAAAGGSDIAMHAAGITLMRGDPRLVAAALDISAATVRKIRQNLFWAFVYNLVGIPLAALGGLTPMWAGAAMAASSVSVVANALLLARWKPAP